MTTDFDQVRYWIQRHRDLKNDPRSVGNLAASLDDTYKGELEFQHAVEQAASIVAGGRRLSVLDLGCGYGRVASSFINAGYRYTGVDISKDAITEARKRCPNGTFLEANLSNYKSKNKFDVVSVLYVFVHFVDDNQWLKFLQTAVGAVKPGGLLFFADHFPNQLEKHGAHVVSRPLHDYVEPLQREGAHLDQELKQAAEATGSKLTRHFQFARKSSS